MKKPILTKYIDHIYYMEEKNADEFEKLFDTLLILLKINHDLTPDIVTHNFDNLTLYSRGVDGDSKFSFRLDGTLVQGDGRCFAVDFQVKIVTDIDLTSIKDVSVNYDFDIYDFKSEFNHEEEFLDFMRQLVRCI